MQLEKYIDISQMLFIGTHENSRLIFESVGEDSSKTFSYTLNIPRLLDFAPL